MKSDATQRCGSDDDQAIVERGELRDRVRVFRDRAHAGALLAEMLESRYAARLATLVLAIPAGGVPVAAPLAARLGLPLDLAVVSKITLPWNSEVGYGAVAFGGEALLNETLVARLGLSQRQVEDGIARTRDKVARRNLVLRRGRGYDRLNGSAVILVDDGLASGFTMRAAIDAVRGAGAAEIVVAVPTAHQSSLPPLLEAVEAVYCANVRGGARFAVADAYKTWTDVSEKEVIDILSASSA